MVYVLFSFIVHLNQFCISLFRCSGDPSYDNTSGVSYYKTTIGGRNNTVIV